jgi:dGTP triphosphohydrolase
MQSEPLLLVWYRKCNRCSEVKPSDKFPKEKWRTWCILCKKEYYKKHYYDHKESYKQAMQRYKLKDTERFRKLHRESYQKNKVKVIKISKLYYQTHKKEKAIYTKIYVIEHKEHLMKKAKEREKNKWLNLADGYIKNLICRPENNLKYADVPDSLIEAYREWVKFKRLKKEIFK